MNALIEQSSRRYHQRVVSWVEIALEEGVRFFVTSLGKPRWVVDRVHGAGGLVYHDVTERKWAEKAVQAGVDGLIGVNSVAGGHAGPRTPDALFAELVGFGLPVICAGGVGDPPTFRRMMELGYDGVQLGTRFIASSECLAHPAYKQAIIDADPNDIVLTERLTGIPVSVISNAYIRELGTRAGPIARLLFRFGRTKRLMRSAYAILSLRRLKKSALSNRGAHEYWQAGKSVGGIRSIAPAGQIVRELAATIDSE